MIVVNHIQLLEAESLGLLYLLLTQMMGGRYCNVMPSDLFKRGALARGSLPAPGKQYASETFRDELRILMRRYTRLCLL